MIGTATMLPRLLAKGALPHLLGKVPAIELALHPGLVLPRLPRDDRRQRHLADLRRAMPTLARSCFWWGVVARVRQEVAS